MASPEDVLLLKLLAARPQDIADAARLVETYRTVMDRNYLDLWARELDLESELREAFSRVSPEPADP